MADKMYPLADLSRLLSVGTDKLRYLIKKGKITPERVGNTLVFRESQLDAIRAAVAAVRIYHRNSKIPQEVAASDVATETA